ncbi:MAG: tetratricopeptide repeat protein, partial [Crocinitomicaceae bacterium]
MDHSFIDSLESIYSKLNGEKQIKKIRSDCSNLGYFHPIEIIYIIDKTIPKLQEDGNSQAEINLLFEKNQIICNALSDFEGSRELSYKMLDELPLSKEEEGLVIDFIARTHLAKSELVKAEELYGRALKILEEMDETHTRAHINVYWGVAVTYAESKHFEKSSEYYQKCLEESEFLGLSDMVASCLMNLAANAGELNDLVASRRYLNDAEKKILSITKKNHRVMD